MKNRRHFLIQSTLATTAMFALKPLTSLGNVISKVTGFNSNYSKLTFLHTAGTVSNEHKAITYIRNIKNSNKNTILLNAGEAMQDEHGSFTYDASMNAMDDLIAKNGEYKIITKGNTRIGIVTARQGEKNVISKIKTLSTYLKQEKNCTVVICLSQLGYKNKKTPDDLKLAKGTTDLDIIIGGHAKNFHRHPLVALNSNNAEVIIHYAAGNSFACGKIEIDFDEMGRKNQVSFADNMSKNTVIKKPIATTA